MARACQLWTRGLAMLVGGMLGQVAGAQTNTASQDVAGMATPGHWSWDALYTLSALDKGRSDWQQLQSEWLYTPSRRWVLGANIDARHRDARADVIYGASAEFYPDARWQWHANVWITPGADFTFRRGLAIGAQWNSRAARATLLLDARQFNFPTGDLHEWRPGVRIALNAATALTGRYTFGQAFGVADYRAWALQFEHDFDNRRRLTLGYARGVDPERDLGVADVVLSRGDLATAYYRFPVHTGSEFDLILGAEYENRRPAYDRIGVSAGVAARF